MKTNTFKSGKEPKKQEVYKQKLNPPHFEEELIDFRNPYIFWGMALDKQEQSTRFNK